jgi:hypothetical protein
VIIKRKMCPGIEGLEGSNHEHDVIPVATAVKYLTSRRYPKSVTAILTKIKAASVSYVHAGSTTDKGTNHVEFGEAVSRVLDKISESPRLIKRSWFVLHLQR